jgi:hypothetical protein
MAWPAIKCLTHEPDLTLVVPLPSLPSSSSEQRRITLCRTERCEHQVLQSAKDIEIYARTADEVNHDPLAICANVCPSAIDVSAKQEESSLISAHSSRCISTACSNSVRSAYVAYVASHDCNTHQPGEHFE